eukprot:scaffold13846_cov34-Cylindrotheca_fusiformis.AAC.1
MMLHAEEAEDEAWIYNGKKEVPPTMRRVKIAPNVTAIPDEAFARHQELEDYPFKNAIPCHMSELHKVSTALLLTPFQVAAAWFQLNFQRKDHSTLIFPDAVRW